MAHEHSDFQWTASSTLAQCTQGDYPWQHYLQTAVEFEGDRQAGTVWPVDCGEIGCEQPPLGPLHIITAVQPDSNPTSAENLARMAVLDHELQTAGIASITAIGVSFDGTHREESRAVFGLDDGQARALGLRFGQVAIFGWRGPRWSLLACATDRQEHRRWRWESLTTQ
ncbi:DUF3293 domain-containing protein [Mycolicibacter arupensis]|jgi:hypothetical protein|uniref:DUF3293 domain-containing protein n=1 Tax=Mycolicibacter arupensis TaxID=342002 RepID=A0A5C7XV54_9MYCO|nr:DUF3293 domain-containing protein [Mycolicibacter arupensis]TXI53447.1 MAG: DUF3293 domain-containing protein [Mycolicibacter arupensis]